MDDFQVRKFAEILKRHGYTYLNPVGKGGFSTVHLVRSTKYNQDFVAKACEYYNQKVDSEAEVANLIHLAHPNIISMYEFFIEGNMIYIILEYCPGGSLLDYIRENGPIEPPHLYSFCAQILSALYHCHARNIAHRDIKPANVLIDVHGRLKLADFGLSSVVHELGASMSTFGGSKPYMSPEIIKKKSHDAFKSDIWSLGVTFYEMAFGDLPWETGDDMTIEGQIEMGMINFIDKDCDYELTVVLRKMLDVNPNKRATLEWLINQELFATYMKQQISVNGLMGTKLPVALKTTSNTDVNNILSSRIAARERKEPICNVLSFRDINRVKKGKRQSLTLPKTFMV